MLSVNQTSFSHFFLDQNHLSLDPNTFPSLKSPHSLLFGGFGLWINFVLLKISIQNRMRKFYCRFYFWNLISTILGWLICTFPSQLSTFCMLHVILHFHKSKGIHNPNDPLHFSCMLGYLGCKMCLFQKLYVEGFVVSFAAMVFHLVGLELIIVFIFPHHLIRIIVQLPIHIFHFCLLLCWLEKGFLFSL